MKSDNSDCPQRGQAYKPVSDYKREQKKYSAVCRIVKDGSQFELLLTNPNNFPHSLIDIGKLYGENPYLFHFHTIFFETVTRTA